MKTLLDLCKLYVTASEMSETCAAVVETGLRDYFARGEKALKEHTDHRHVYDVVANESAQAWDRGDDYGKIQAIKTVRSILSFGLKDAKDWVEAHYEFETRFNEKFQRSIWTIQKEKW